MKILKGLFLVGLSVMTLHVKAALINFETNTFGLQPTDNEVVSLTDVFEVNDVRVRFGFDTDSDGVLDTEAVLEQADNTDAGEDTGFWGIGGARDVAAPGFESVLGDFFLRQLEPYTPFGVFTILYDADIPVTAASGEIWDIDGRPGRTEQFSVQAFNGDNLLETILSPMGTDLTLNGQPWGFGFSDLTDITKIEITFTGTKTSGIGLAFNNFSPVTNQQQSITVDEPNLLVVIICGTLLLCLRRVASTAN